MLAAGPTTSVECFPPRTPEGIEQLDRCLAELAPVGLDFVSITYGAGGTTRDLTRNLVVGVDGRQPYPVMPHLTCIGHTRAELAELLDDYIDHGIDNVLALAGDPPADGSPAAGDFAYAVELIELIRERGDVSVGVAAFPEGHPRSATIAEDRARLAEKLEAADFGITQFFFDADDYLRMVDDLAGLGSSTPVLPGIVIVSSPATIRRFAQMNGAKFPEDLAGRIDDAEGADRQRIVVDAAVALCERLRSAGVPGLHFYGLNRSEIVLEILDAIN